MDQVMMVDKKLEMDAIEARIKDEFTVGGGAVWLCWAWLGGWGPVWGCGRRLRLVVWLASFGLCGLMKHSVDG
jgi:hypothetical protein